MILFLAWMDVFLVLFIVSLVVYMTETRPWIKTVWTYFLVCYALSLFVGLNLYIITNETTKQEDKRP